MITDNDVIKLFFREDRKVNPNYIRKNWLDKHHDIKEYLAARYQDSLSISETLYRILLGIEIRPVCKTCGAPVKFDPSHCRCRGRNGNPFREYCSQKCMANSDDIIIRKKNTVIANYRVDNVMKSEDVRLKMKASVAEKFGVENAYSSEVVKAKIRKTCLDRYGVEFYVNHPDYQNKSKNTCLSKYGVDSYAKSQEFKDMYAEHKDEYLERAYEVKKANKSFNISKKEDFLYNCLCRMFSGVQRQYKSSEYPFACDFYIPGLDLYIEYNGNWTHGPHRYDKMSSVDTYRLREMTEKAEKSKYYRIAVKVWTDSDIKKRNTAKDNMINYLEVFQKFPLSEVPGFIMGNFKPGDKNKQITIGES